jgi:hypothetical protein
MFHIALVLFTALQSLAQQPAQDEIKDGLAHAEALYYGARFNESIALLTRIEDTLKTQPGRLQEKINTKLRLALAEIGLNDTAKAKSFLVDLYALDSNYVLDPDQFSPKVISVAAEAKAEQSKLQCFAAQSDARAFLENGKTKELLDLIRTSKSSCAPLAAVEPEAAESFYKSGLAAYRRNDFSAAATFFEATVALAPENELAFQYIDLIHSNQELSHDRLFLQWQKDFDARLLTAAGADYRQITSLKDSRDAAVVAHMRDEYRKALTQLVETWNRTCKPGDPAVMNAIRGQITELLPEPTFGEDIRAQMISCEDTNKNAANATGDSKAVSNSACIEMQPQLALARLKTRVDPAISNELRVYLKNSTQVSVRTKVRISETGDVTVTGVPAGNPVFNTVVSNAVAQWKFVPARDQNGPRCVDTEIPLVIKLSR